MNYQNNLLFRTKIHPSVSRTCWIPFMVTDLPEPTQLVLGKRGVHAATNRSPVSGRATHSHTCTPRDNLESPINLWSMFLDFERKTHACTGTTCELHTAVRIWTSAFLPRGESTNCSHTKQQNRKWFSLKECDSASLKLMNGFYRLILMPFSIKIIGKWQTQRLMKAETFFWRSIKLIWPILLF